MSYPKANLGALVIPINDYDYDSHTWEEFRDLYGFDLSSCFSVTGTLVYRNTTKPLYVYIYSDGGSLFPALVSTNDSDGTGNIRIFWGNIVAYDGTLSNSDLGACLTITTTSVQFEEL